MLISVSLYTHSSQKGEYFEHASLIVCWFGYWSFKFCLIIPSQCPDQHIKSKQGITKPFLGTCTPSCLPDFLTKRFLSQYFSLCTSVSVSLCGISSVFLFDSLSLVFLFGFACVFLCSFFVFVAMGQKQLILSLPYCECQTQMCSCLLPSLSQLSLRHIRLQMSRTKPNSFLPDSALPLYRL